MNAPVSNLGETCPRRMEEFGPWEHALGLDAWVERWHEPEKGDKWQWPWRPLVCSFCGGARPQDAIRLVEEGWRRIITNEGSKCYLAPPGEPWNPTPPVKIYVQHFDTAALYSLSMVHFLERRKAMPELPG